MKKFVFILLAIVISQLFALSAVATSSADESQWTYAPIELETSNSLQKGSARGVEISIYRSAYHIPDNTPMLTEGVVLDGIITYEIRVGILVTNNGTACANQSVSWSTTATSANACLVSGDSKTNSNGQAFAYFHVRDLSSVPVQVVCGGVTATNTIVVPVDQLYDSSFYLTYYIIADENDYSGSKTVTVPGISGQFKQKFLDAVRLNGSGRDSDGRYIKYYNGYSLYQPTTASGTTPVAGRTIAVDPHYIPMVNKNGWKRGTVDIMTTGLRRAEDTGGAIDEFRIDVFAGIGMSCITEDNHDSAVLFKGVNTWESLSNRNQDASENYWDVADLTTVTEATHGIWYSEERDVYAFISGKDYTNTESRIVVTINKIAETKNCPTQLSLSPFALDVEDVVFIDEVHVGIESHINPSTNIYEIFDVNTGAVVEVYYGYGFTHDEDTIYYVQAPQHFSGVSGQNRIISSKGVLLYESDANVIIGADLAVRNNSIYFTESFSGSGEKEMRNVEISDSTQQVRNGDIYYY